MWMGQPEEGPIPSKGQIGILMAGFEYATKWDVKDLAD
jgi:hypothetical protein